MWDFIKRKENWSFLRFAIAQLVSQFGDRVHQMALVGLIAQRWPGSPFELAKLLSFTIIPVFLIGPIAGVYVDRWDRRTTLFVCDILRGILVLIIAVYVMDLPSIVPVYAMVFAIFAFSRFYVPAKMALVPQLVDKSDLLLANSIITVTGMIALVLGALFGGIIVEQNGPKGGFYFDAFTFFLSAALLFTVSKVKRWQISKEKIVAVGRDAVAAHKNVWHEIVDGITYIKGQNGIRFIFLMMSILFSAAGAIYVIIIVFIQQAFGSVTKDLGFLAVPLGIGLFLGSMAFGRYGKNLSKYKTIFWSLILGGIMVTIFAVAVTTTHDRTFAAALAAILGFVVGPMVIAANTVIHSVCSEKLSGKVFAALEFVMHLAFLVAMLLSAYVAEFVSRHWILMAIGVIFFVVGVIGLIKFKEEK